MKLLNFQKLLSKC